MPLKKNPAYARSILNIYPDPTARKKQGWIVSRSYIQETPGADPMELAFSTAIDTSKPVLYLVNLMTVLASYSKHSNKEQTAKIESSVGGDFCNFFNESAQLHALVRMILRLDSMSSVIAWSMTSPEDGPTTIDVVEFPRLRLTFEKRVSNKGVVRYFCVEQSGLYLSGYKESLGFLDLLYDLPHAVLLLITIF